MCWITFSRGSGRNNYSAECSAIFCTTACSRWKLIGLVRSGILSLALRRSFKPPLRTKSSRCNHGGSNYGSGSTDTADPLRHAIAARLGYPTQSVTDFAPTGGQKIALLKQQPTRDSCDRLYRLGSASLSRDELHTSILANRWRPCVLSKPSGRELSQCASIVSSSRSLHISRRYGEH